jgi:hypothetical protein
VTQDHSDGAAACAQVDREAAPRQTCEGLVGKLLTLRARHVDAGMDEHPLAAEARPAYEPGERLSGTAARDQLAQSAPVTPSCREQFDGLVTRGDAPRLLQRGRRAPENATCICPVHDHRARPTPSGHLPLPTLCTRQAV